MSLDLPLALRSIAVFGFAVLQGCTTSGRGTHPAPEEPLAKVGSKDEPKDAPLPASIIPRAPDQGVAASSNAAAPTVEQQLAYVQRLTLPATEFADAERDFLARLPPRPDHGSVAEAATVLGLLRTVLTAPAPTASSFREQDLSSKDPAAPAPSTQASAASLESLCKDRGVNLRAALVENPLLGNANVAKQVNDALARGGATDAYRDEIAAALRKEAGQWSAVAPSAAGPGLPANGTPPPSNPAAAATPSSGATTAAIAPASLPSAGAAAALAPPAPAGAPPAPGVPPGSGDGADKVLAQAQAEADKGNFQAAVQLAAAVPAASPLRDKAQQRARDFSDLAVQELRRKAAAAFQSAMPISDPKLRAEYLKQAKTLLESAVRDFPDATLLPTVRDNLRMISQDLERLEGSTAAAAVPRKSQ